MSVVVSPVKRSQAENDAWKSQLDDIETFCRVMTLSATLKSISRTFKASVTETATGTAGWRKIVLTDWISGVLRWDFSNSQTRFLHKKDRKRQSLTSSALVAPLRAASAFSPGSSFPHPWLTWETGRRAADAYSTASRNGGYFAFP